jgi:hypothetical protein
MASAKAVKFASGFTGAGDTTVEGEVAVASVEAFDVAGVDAKGVVTAKDEEVSVERPLAWRRLSTAEESLTLVRALSAEVSEATVETTACLEEATGMEE